MQVAINRSGYCKLTHGMNREIYEILYVTDLNWMTIRNKIIRKEIKTKQNHSNFTKDRQIKEEKSRDIIDSWCFTLNRGI